MKRLLIITLALACAITCAIGLSACGSGGCKHSRIADGEVVSSTATCSSAGTETVKCPDCDYKETREVQAYGHAFEQIDANGNKYQNRYDYENLHCKYCCIPKFTFTAKQTLPTDIQTVFSGNNNTIWTSNIKVKSFNVSIEDYSRLMITFNCEKSENSSAEAYLWFKVKITDEATSSSVTYTLNYSKSQRAQERMIKVGDEFKHTAVLKLGMNDTEWKSGGMGNYIWGDKKQDQGKFTIEITGVTLTTEDVAQY